MIKKNELTNLSSTMRTQKAGVIDKTTTPLRDSLETFKKKYFSRIDIQPLKFYNERITMFIC